EEWIKTLENPSRIAGLKVDQIVGSLRLKPGETIADLGAGAGVFSIPLARAVSPSGKVYAVEIEQGLVDYIGRKAKDQNVANVQPILGKFADPGLPARDVDLAFMHDVLHHVQDRPAYLKNTAAYIKPGGRFAFIEFDAALGPHRADAALQVTKEQLREWMTGIGFEQTDEFGLFEDRWFVIYTRRR
ncbi:MAG TPA: class I SAM-dependent methyltransferase, partial [Vicinamibacterales bacterium]|nr:class I SAM-dependent methyltransferase [Vicinamibacterales bacterium]